MTKPRSVELDADGVAVFGESTERQDARGTVLLLHDRDRDIDALRAFIPALHTLLLDTVLVDLPGHGLSGGAWDADAAGAVRSALELAARSGRPVGVIAVGAAAGVLLRQAPGPVGAIALIAPTVTAAEFAAAPAWRSVPQISFGDPCDPAVARSLDDLGRWVRAWSVRVHVHQHEPDAAGAPTPHMTHSSAAFLAEQIAYLSSPRPAVEHPEPPPAGQNVKTRS